MQLDTDRTFGQLYKPGDIRRILYQLYQLLGTRKDALRWARDLRFLAPAPESTIYTEDIVDDIDASEPLVGEDCSCNNSSQTIFQALTHDAVRGLLQVTKQSQLPDCNHYAAISWVWEASVPPRAAVNACERYTILDGDRECWIPHHIVSRAINFAAHYQLSYIWFDKECIDQTHPKEKELGIQAMDVVYQRSLYPVALLQVHIATQRQLDLLCQMIEGTELPADDLPDLLSLLQLIDNDRYFTRTWCLQESVAGGIEMAILIPHAPDLDKPEVLGTIPGEVETSIIELTQAVGYAHSCVLLCDEPLSTSFITHFNDTVDHILSFLPTETAKPDTGYDDPEWRQTCNASQALIFLNQRQNHRVADRIAILGNMCNYGSRLDTNAIEAAGYGFSICAFALAIFNGDFSLLQPYNPVVHQGDVLDFSWGPRTGFRINRLLPAMDVLPVRTGLVEYTGDGLRVKGWLWRVEDVDINVNSNSAPSSDDDPALLIWNFLKHLLLEQDEPALAQTIYASTRVETFGPLGFKANATPTPTNITSILSPDGDLIYTHPKYINSEADFRNIFQPTGPPPNDKSGTNKRAREGYWKRNEWLWGAARTGTRCVWEARARTRTGR